MSTPGGELEMYREMMDAAIDRAGARSAPGSAALSGDDLVAVVEAMTDGMLEGARGRPYTFETLSAAALRGLSEAGFGVARQSRLAQLFDAPGERGSSAAARGSSERSGTRGTALRPGG